MCKCIFLCSSRTFLRLNFRLNVRQKHADDSHTTAADKTEKLLNLEHTGRIRIMWVLLNINRNEIDINL